MAYNQLLIHQNLKEFFKMPSLIHPYPVLTTVQIMELVQTIQIVFVKQTIKAILVQLIAQKIVVVMVIVLWV